MSSVPAGTASMPLVGFLAASVAGATIWNNLPALGRVAVRPRRAGHRALKWYLDLVGVGLLALLFAYVVWEVRRARREKV